MLASLLPGLRELRAPLAAGYLWLLGIWLTLLALPAAPDYSTGLYRHLVDLANWAGKPALFVASAFVAYLLGVLSNFIIGIATRDGSRLVAAVARRLEGLKRVPAGPVNVNRILSVLALQLEHAHREVLRQMDSCGASI